MPLKKTVRYIIGIGSFLFLTTYILVGLKIFKGDEAFAGRETCGTSPGPVGYFSSDMISLTARSGDIGEVIISGYVYVSKASYDSLNLAKHPLKLRLEPLQTNYSGAFLFDDEIEFESWSLYLDGPNKNAVAKIKPKPVYLNGDPRDFPFEKYRYGYKAIPYIEKNNQLEDVHFKYAHNIIQLSPFFIPKRSETTEDYMDHTDSPFVTEADIRNYKYDECAIKIERTLLFKLTVGLLTGLLFFPFIYSMFRTDKQPAVDIAATIISVAAIRTFLIGPMENFQFYKIDVIFGLAVVMTATIPLIMSMWSTRVEKLLGK